VEIRGLIRSLGQDRTVIISSHILPEVLATCNRMVIINRGRVVADGTPEELEARHSPGTEYHLRFRSGVPGHATADLQAGLGALPSVRRVEEGRRSGGGEVELLVHTDGGADLREVVLNAARTRGWPLLEIHKERLELERIFHKLTQE
jgi:ABC-2 type transport system ATP-binding protein